MSFTVKPRKMRKNEKEPKIGQRKGTDVLIAYRIDVANDELFITKTWENYKFYKKQNIIKMSKYI